MRTIGVSIAVPDPFGSDLQDYRVRLGDRSARWIPTHITLAPPLDYPKAELDRVVDHLRAVAARQSPFEVHLRGTGTFRPVSPVVFVAVAEGISSCEMLAADVRGGPLGGSAKFPYHPHVTVAHELEDTLLDRAFADLSGFEAHFEVSEFWLYIHEEEAGWQPTEAFPLTRSR